MNRGILRILASPFGPRPLTRIRGSASPVATVCDSKKLSLERQ